ncbi:MAG: hypothetical protein J6A99_03475 [Clostridia bacterium]|nr:hypothetical protein [Clostridia bacterium]
MDTFSIVIVGGLVVSLLLGILLGFGRVLKFLTGGIVGIIISIFVCIMFGGIIANFSLVSELIASGNEYFGEIAEILAKMNVATIIYYIALFFVVQILRIIVVKIIAKMFQPERGTKGYKVRNVINRTLGVILMGGGWILLVYFVLAVMSLLTDVPTIGDFILKMETEMPNSIFYQLYTHNPIDLSVLFG